MVPYVVNETHQRFAIATRLTLVAVGMTVITLIASFVILRVKILIDEYLSKEVCSPTLSH